LIKNSNFELDNFIRNSPLAIVIANGEGIIEAVNPMTEDMFGFKASELIGKPIESLIPDDLRKKHIEHRSRYITQPYTRPMGIGLDLMGRKKSGEAFPIEIGLSYSRHGDDIRITSYISDISARKRSDYNLLNQLENEKNVTDRELAMAQKVQASFLPKDLPKIPGLSVAVKWLPAREVGGDFYDVIQWPNGNCDLVIADVTGKGVPAALFMASACTALRASLNSTSSLEEGIYRTNQLVSQDSNQGLYVTLFVARINTKIGEVSYVNGGHNPPFHYSHDKEMVSALTRTGKALGIETQSSYQQRTVHLEPMDFIVFYTDGVTEANDTHGQDFGAERLQQVIMNHRDATAEEMVGVISEAVNEYISPAPLPDDTTIMVAKRE
jgi:sigma-B regulation protein RsbU (phosphoserine phosphatase)